MKKNTTKIIDGKKLAEKIKNKVVDSIIKLNSADPADKKKPRLVENRPNLAIILVGDQEDSLLYVKKKEEEAKKVGLDTHLYRCPADIPKREVFEMIDCLNKDDLIDGILVQLPLPDNFDTDGIIMAIDPKKDVDRFHPDNLKKILLSCDHNLMPPVFGTVLVMLESINYDLKNKQVCIISNSDIFGKTLAKTLECRGAGVDVVRVRDNDLKKRTSQADILISAVGKPSFIKKDMIKNDAVIIDVGITKKGKKVYGDVDFENVKKKVAFITPVPGGVGPMTIAMLFKNTLELYKQRKQK